MTMVSPSAKTKDTLGQPHNVDSDDSGKSENYESLNLVGTGAYGSVYRYWCKSCECLQL